MRNCRTGASRRCTGSVGRPTKRLAGRPSLVESIRHYRWLVVLAVLVGGVAAYLWSSMQPVRYEGVAASHGHAR
jgi:hypothetical protein